MALGAEVELEKVIKVEKIDGIFHVHTEEGSTFQGKTVILALGVKHRTLGLPGEEELIGNGISFCAVCDGAFYTGQEVAMIGGGNSALQEALLLSEVCTKVTVVQNLADFTGEKRLAEALLEKENVEVYFSTLVDGYEQENGSLTGLRLRNDITGELSHIRVDGAFLAVGLMPENDAFAHMADLNDWGYFDSAEDCCTRTPGLFVAGDCRSKRIRQVVTAAADGAIAAMAACRYLEQ
jgi:thioredoxin reductase (NADPH)